MEWTAGTLLPPFPIELLGDPQRLGIGLDDAPQGRALPVELSDALEIVLGNGARGETPRLHLSLQRGDTGFVELKRLRTPDSGQSAEPSSMRPQPSVSYGGGAQDRCLSQEVAPAQPGTASSHGWTRVMP